MDGFDNPVDIYIVGTGMVGYRQMTEEAEAALRNSETAYLIHYQKVVADYVEDTVASELGDVSGELIQLTDEYQEDEDRANTYERMAARVMDGAEAADNPVCLALYGHPNVFVSPTEWIADEAEERNMNVDIRPGVSSMDALYSDLMLDPSRNGIQMFEATDLLIREFDLNPHVPAFIWQIGTLETVLYTTADSSPERFERFREYLERFYPSDHTVYICQTAVYPTTQSKQIPVEIGDFEEKHDEINGVQTLYVPPVERKEVVNEELEEQVVSSDHLETITEN
ncbi:SAM-dependent methyltransferase [Halobaculum sp. MBLA0147]|uniref:SAM-dependent methyltransferase n=1 Tax=Halobaculum sp. MBLA0147 TaxID=3079934 RepID=UPI0035234776